MKKKLFSLVVVFLIMCTMMQPLFAIEAIHKEEVVYSKMNHDGSIASIFVVNSFNVLKDHSQIVDYGPYLNVTNTTTTQPIAFDGLKTNIVDVEKGRFFYQGELNASTQLPWLIEMNYTLDNQPISADQLAGNNGKLTCEIHIKQNKNVNPIYFDNYLLTITINLNSLNVQNLKAEGATIANAGQQKTIVFTSLPKKEAIYRFEADINDFEMPGMQFAALPFKMALDLPDTSQFTQGISKLQGGIQSLNFGATQLAKGINQLNSNGSNLKNGAKELSEGATKLKNGLSQSSMGSVKFVDGLSQYTDGVNKVSLGSKELVNGSSQIKNGINKMANELNQQAGSLKVTDQQKEMIASSLTALKGLKSFLKDDLGSAVFLPVSQALKRETILKIYPDLDLKNPQIQSLLAYMELQAKTIEKAFNLLNPMQDSIKNSLAPNIDSMIKLIEGISDFGQLIDGVNQLNQQYSQFHTGLQKLSDGLAKLEHTSGQLVSGGTELKKGLNQLNQGVSQFANGMDQYSTGISSYTHGVSELNSGAQKLSNGTYQLNQATQGIDELMQQKIKELMKDYQFEEFEMKSFVSDKNKNTDLVQFVFMTQPILKPVVKQEVVSETPQKSLWDLIVDLFK